MRKGGSMSGRTFGSFIALAVALAAAPARPAEVDPSSPMKGEERYPPFVPSIAEGPFEPEYESLARYRCPEWFRDAKLGIWAHWGPQAVPMAGDWYARHLYVQGHRQYEHHLKNYGHPTKLGYKDIIPLWKAEKWDPDRLMALYKKAGARYFVSMGVHHDNFDLWNSTHHRWNAVKMGPHRDVVGDWQKAAKKLGLRFGVSEHLGASFTWFQDSHKSDKVGPLAGVPYDGADPQYADLYHPPAMPGDNGWYSKDPRWHRTWFGRIKDLVEQYRPDLLYTDGGVPFDGVGRSLIAHLYNSDPRRQGTSPEVVYTCKQESKGMWVQDLERGVMAGILADPWQTDTSIGDWYYNVNWKFRGADWVIHMLADIVSKNGNLLLNVVQRPDGSIDPEAEAVLEELAAWTAVNGEAIFETRPWLRHGEGPVRAKGGHFGEDFAYSGKDIRFTRKGETTLYAIALGWPADGKILIRSLAKLPGVTGKVTAVTLLGHAGTVPWIHGSEGLEVVLPAEQPSKHAVSLKITGTDLLGFKPEEVLPDHPVILPDASGAFLLRAEDADLQGGLREENQGGQPNIGFWDNAADSASWKVKFGAPGRFKVAASCGTIHREPVLVLEAGGRKVEFKVPFMESWDRFAEIDAGAIEIEKAGATKVTLRPRDAASWKAVNLRWVKLVPAK
jgi:alpha-L-fucosidase